jgi:hypothetical protein
LDPASIIKEFPCLGLEFLGNCSYDPSSPSRVYFSIGQAVSVLALFLAFTQLLRPILRFRLATGIFRQKTAYTLFTVAIFSIFIAAALPFIPGPALPLLGYPIFWEFLAGLLFVFGALGFLWSINRSAKYSRKNYKTFFDYCTSLIAKGNDNDLRELSEEIFDSIKNVISACSKYDRYKAMSEKERNEKYEVSEYTEYALSLLDIWSDAKLCEIMVCNVPATVIELFRQIDEQHFYNSGGYSLVKQIIHQAYFNKSSILHREEDYEGLGHFKTFTTTVFGNHSLIESNFRPLQAWTYWKEEDVKEWHVEKYCKTLQVALKSYFASSGWGHGFPSAIYSAFSVIKGIVMSESIKLDKTPDSDVYESPYFRKLSIIERGLQKFVKIVIENAHKLPEYKFVEENYNHFHDHSIYGILANAIFEYYEHLAMARSQDEATRMLAINIWLDVYPVSKGLESKPIEEVQKRLNLLLSKKVEENLTNQYYPAVTRLLLNIVGLFESKENVEEYGAITFKNKLFSLIQMHFENAFNNNSKKALDMIPANTKYVETEGKLVQVVRIDGEARILNLRHEAQPDA